MKLKRIILIVLLCSLSLFAGCSQSPKSDAIYIEDLTKASKEAEKQRLQEIRVKKAEEIEKHYGGDFYYGDYRETIDKLNRQYEALLNAKFKGNIKKPFIVKADVEYYNSSLQIAQDKGWNIEDILKDPAEHIRTLRFNLYFFSVFENNNEITDYFLSVVEECRNLGLANMNIRKYEIDESVLNTYSLDNLYELDIHEIVALDKVRYISEKGNERIGLQTGEMLIEKYAEFKEKYNQDFIFVSDISKLGYGYGTYALKSKPEIVFQDGAGGDKFLTALAQYYMYDLVYEILVEEGAENHIIPLTIPNDIEDSRTDRNGYDTGNIKTREDIIEFLEEGYGGEYDVTLVYLKDKEADIDYAKLQRIAIKIRKLLKDSSSSGHDNKPLILFVEYYNIDESKHALVKEIFLKNKVCSGIYRKTVTLANLYEMTNMTREEIDGFHYLDRYAEKVEGMLSRTGHEPELLESFTLEEFIERTTKDGKY